MYLIHTRSIHEEPSMAKTKKVKSFTIDEGPYNELFGMFKENYVDVSISYCLNKYIKELAAYLQAIRREVKDSEGYTVPMSFVIETVAREPIFQVPEDKAVGEGESPLRAEVKELQRRYDAYTKKGVTQAEDETQITELDTMTALLKFMKVIGRALGSQIKNWREPTDDEYIEMLREEGGKPLHKAVREKLAPAMEKIDPDLKDLFKGKSKRKEKKKIEEE